VTDRVLDRQHRGEALLLPQPDDPVELSGLVRRVAERDVVAVLGERVGKVDGVVLEDARAVLELEAPDVGLERKERRRAPLHEVDRLAPARHRFDPQRARAGKEVEDARVGQLGLQQVQQRRAHVLGGRPHAAIAGRGEVAPCKLAADDAHAMMMK